MTRLLLAMASECDAEGPLTGLREVAEEVLEVLCDPHRGACDLVRVGGASSSGLLFNPTTSMLLQAFDESAKRIQDQVLVIYWIGHGRALARHERQTGGAGFYLMPIDAGGSQGVDDPGVELGPLLQRIKAAEPRGVLVLLDACQSGVVTEEALGPWLAGPGDVPLVILTSTRNNAARDLAFSRALTRLLNHGIGSPGDQHLTAAGLNFCVGEIAREQTSALLQHNQAHDPPELWLSRNVAHARRKFSLLPEEHVENLVLTEMVRAVVALRDQPNLALIGDAGSGKTTLGAMLVRLPTAMRRALGLQHFVDAAVFATQGMTSSRVATALNGQLALEKGFRQAASRYETRTDLATEEKLLIALRDWMQSDADDPQAGRPRSITLLFDSLDSLPSGFVFNRVIGLIDDLALIPGVHVITSARPDTRLPANAHVRHIGRANENEVLDYLERRRVAPALREVLVRRAQGLWLCVYAFSEYAQHRGDLQAHDLEHLTLEAAFGDLLERIGVLAEPQRETVDTVAVVFGTLAAAGAGAVIPRELLRLACAQQLGDFSEDALQSAVGKLRGLVERSGTGTEEEHLGLFHQELATHARRSHKKWVDAGHESILKAIAQAEDVERGTPTWRYAFSREAGHLYQLGRWNEIVPSLTRLRSWVPRENLDRWTAWQGRLAGVFESDHHHMLTTRFHVAHWTGQSGDVAGALELCKALLPDQTRVLGADDPDVLTTRNNFAHWTGETGDVSGALELYKALLPDQTRVLGADHPDVLTTRNNIASWTFRTGDVSGALVLSKALLADQTRVLGADHPDVLTTRNNIAVWTGQIGDGLVGALDLFRALLPDLRRVFGAGHPRVVAVRRIIIACIKKQQIEPPDAT